MNTTLRLLRHGAGSEIQTSTSLRDTLLAGPLAEALQVATTGGQVCLSSASAQWLHALSQRW